LKPTRQRPYRKESKKKNTDPTPEYFKMTPSQHPHDKELVQRREVLEAIQTIQSFLKGRHADKTLLEILDELYTEIEEDS
jgi:hypothetical protein